MLNILQHLQILLWYYNNVVIKHLPMYNLKYNIMLNKYDNFYKKYNGITKVFGI